MRMLSEYPGIRVKGNEIVEVVDAIVVEDRFDLYLNDELLTRLVASDEYLQELGAGFVVGEGLADTVDSVQVSAKEIRVYAEPMPSSEWVLKSSGGPGTSRAPKEIRSSLTIEPRDVLWMIKEIESEVWRKTGGVHCSVLFLEKELVIRSSDVGRHNTYDKVLGFAVLNHIDVSRCVVGCTGRQPSGMVSKVANVGVPIILSKAAATDKGIVMADQAGVTLVCFARGNRFTVYTHPHRISGIVPEVRS